MAVHFKLLLPIDGYPRSVDVNRLFRKKKYVTWIAFSTDTEWNMRVLIFVLPLLIAHCAAAGYCPSACICTMVVTNCSNSNLTVSPNDIDHDVRILDLSYNKISTADFSGLFHVESIIIAHCKVTKASFKFLPNIAAIDLSYNNIENLGWVSLDNLKNLVTLNLSNNLFSTFKGLVSSSVEVLDLSSSKLVIIGKNLKRELPSLRILNIRNNPLQIISQLESDTLYELDVSDCQLTGFPSETLRRLPNLSFLNASNNHNLRFSSNDRYCSNLEKADFSRTGTSDIDIRGLCSIDDINFSFNSISQIDENTLKFNKKLKTLNLSHNILETIHENAFYNHSKLKQLDLFHNMLRTAEWTKHLNNLVFLNLSQNELYNLQDIFLPEIILFDVSQNHIFRIEIYIEISMPVVEFINLSHNMLTSLPNLSSKTLRTLKLSYCQLASVSPMNFKDLTNLNFLDLEGNKFTRIDFTVFAKLPSLKDIRLGNNPWNCECKTERFHQLYIYLAVNRSITNAHELICDQSGGQTWLEACTKDWKYGSNNGPFPAIVAVVVFFVLSLLGMGVLIFIRYRANKLRMDDPPTATSTGATMQNQLNMRRVMSDGDIVRRTTFDSDVRDSQPPPSYEEALLLPTLSEVERMTRSMSVLSDRTYSP